MRFDIASPVLTLILLGIVGLPVTAIGVGFIVVAGESLGWARIVVAAGLLAIYFGALGSTLQLLSRR